MNLGDALKQVRRQIYLHGDVSRTLILCRDHRSVPALCREVTCLMAGSSLQPKAGAACDTITTDKGGYIRCAAVGDLTDAYLFSGSQWTNIVWLHNPDERMQEYMHGKLRSPVLSYEDCKELRADW